MPKKRPDELLSPEVGAYAPTFEESLSRLQEIVEQLEDGQLSLAQSLAAYEEGVKHLKVCYEALSETERKIEILAGFDAAGNPITRPFDDTATADQQAPARRVRPRATPGANASAPPEDAVDERRELF